MTTYEPSVPCYISFDAQDAVEKAETLYRVAYLLNSIEVLAGAPCRVAFDAAHDALRAAAPDVAHVVENRIMAESDPCDLAVLIAEARAEARE